MPKGGSGSARPPDKTPRRLGSENALGLLLFAGLSFIVEAVAQLITPASGGSHSESSFSLRAFRSQDLPRLSEIDRQCFQSGIAYDEAELASYIRRPGTLTLVAEQRASAASGSATPRKVAASNTEGSIMGFLVAQKPRLGIGHIITIDVLPQARRSGLGTLLMNQAESELRKAGCKSVFLEVAVNNAAAIQFYKRLGYFVLKTLPRYYQGELDAFLMVKRVVEPVETPK